MNFDHVNKQSDYWRNEIAPHLSSRMQITDFGNYLSKMSDAPSCNWVRHELRVYAVNYLVDPVAFVKKHSKKCVAFTGTPTPQDGAMTVVYQMSPTLHVLARLYQWIEHNEVRAYLMLTVAYRDHCEYLEFFDDTKKFRLAGNTEDRPVGYGAVLQNADGMKNFLKGFQQGNGREVTEDNNPGEELNH